MRTFLYWLALVVTAYVVQTSFLPLIFYRGIGPDLLLLITISFAFLKGRRLGCFMGFLLGLFGKKLGSEKLFQAISRKISRKSTVFSY